MKTKTILLLSALALGAGGVAYGLREYFRGPVDAGSEDTTATLSAEALVAEFIVDENAANAKYVGRVIEVSGTPSTVEGNTVTLSAGGTDDLVTCAFVSAPVARAATPVRIKGEVSGSVTLLGTEVQLVRCTIVE